MSVQGPMGDLIKQETKLYQTAIIRTKCDATDSNSIITTAFIQKPSPKARRASG